MSSKPPRLHINNNDPEDYFRRLITYSFAVARLYGKADGGAVEDAARAAFGKGGVPDLIKYLKQIYRTSRADRPTAYFEVAPGETWDAALQKAWESMSPEAKQRITEQGVNEFFKPWQNASGIRGELTGGLGGFNGFTNPSKVFYPNEPHDLHRALNDIGELYAQDMMLGVSPKPFEGSKPAGLVTLQLPKNVEQNRVHDIYQELFHRGLARGHSTDVGRGEMSTLVPENQKTFENARAIDDVLGGQYRIKSRDAHYALPTNGEDYGLQGPLRDLVSRQSAFAPERPQAGVGLLDLKSAARDRVRSLVQEEVGRQAPLPVVEKGGGGAAIQNALRLARKLGKLHPEGSGYVSVPGKPSVVTLPGFGRVEARPIPEVEAAVQAHQRAAGLTEEPTEGFAPFNPAFASKVAQAFGEMKHDTSDPAVRRAYDAMIDDTMSQYRAAKDTGIDFRFLKPGETDPYAASAALGYEDIVNKGRLFVFPTDQGFGTLTEAAADNPLLRRAGRVGDKNDAVINDAFRIVHDLYGHYGPGNPFFRAPGEERAFQLHSKMFSPEALPAATSETRGQNSWVNYGPHGPHNRSASGADTVYADQKVGKLPDWTMAAPPAADHEVEDYIRSLIGRATGGEVDDMIQDRYPSHYMPGVGRQVMADGGAPVSAPITGQHTITAQDLIGVAAPSGQNIGAYTDAGGQQIAAPFVSSMSGGYPVYNIPKPEAASTQANGFDLRSLMQRIYGQQFGFGSSFFGKAEGGEVEEPGSRAHEFVQEQLYGDLLRPSPLVDQYADKTAAAALQANADRPMPTAHEFVQHQLNKQEHQLPQMDREARDTMRDYATDALHLGAYFTPAAPAIAAYDAYKGLQSGNTLEMGLAATGLPGRTAKAGMLAASLMYPTEAQAGPVNKALEVARRLSPFGHYSPAAEAVAGVKQEKGRIGDFLNAIKGKPGVTAEELRHAGIESAFAPDATVTRDEVADFLHNKLPQIQEKVYGGAPITHTPREIAPSEHYGEDDVPGWLQAMYEVGPRNRPYIIKDAGDEYYLHGPKDDNLGDFTSLEAAVQAAHDAMAGRDPVKYGEYALPGGERYREVTMQLPPTGSGSDRGFRSQHWSDPNVLAHLRMSDRQEGLSGDQAVHILRRIAVGNGLAPEKFPHLGSGSVNLAVREGAITPEEAASISRHKGWRSSDYFDKPGLDKKVLHLDEIQSDWGQKGRDEGFRDPIAEAKARDEHRRATEELNSAHAALLPKYHAWEDAQLDSYLRNSEKLGMTPQDAADLKEATLKDRQRMPVERQIDVMNNFFRTSEPPTQALFADNLAAIKAAEQRRDAAVVAGHQAGKGLASGPYVTSTEGWTDLALKRALREAAEGGYDKMVWTPGAAQADRYDLAKQVKAVHYFPEHKNFQAIPHNGRVGISENNVEPKDLSKYVGKDVAKKLLEAPLAAHPLTGHMAHSLDGLDLKVGGNGMLDYYDKVVPSRLQKLIKKLGHSPLIEMASHELPSASGEGSIMGHALTMTPELREAILKGLPAFEQGGRVNYEDGGGIVDRALSFLSQFNPVSEAHAETPLATAAAAALNLAKKYGRTTVNEPYRKAFPGIYGNPREIVQEAESRVAPESPALKQLFGVDRQDLYDLGANRAGNMEPQIAMKPGARGTPSATNLMTKRNEQRLQDVLYEAGKMPGLRTGMDPWYTMDPLFWRMKELFGEEEAIKRYNILNHAIGTMSPGAPVETEINRGLAANYAYHQGRFGDFEKYAGMKGKDRGDDFPADLARVQGHAYHSTSQTPPLRKYLETGDHGMQSPKVPLYIQASGVPETGFQTTLPVPDAHFTRAVGMADTRSAPNDFGVSMKMPEYQPVGPWFRESVAKPLGMEAVPAQARLWGAMSGQTGVDTAIGSPKIKMLANEIMKIANHHGIPPETARDLVLKGELYKRGGSVIDRALEVVSQVLPKKKAA